MNNFKKAFGAHLRKIRKSYKLTQEEFSEKINIHPRQVSKIETGSHFPNSSTLENICNVLQIEPLQLFDFKILKNIENNSTLNTEKNIKNNEIDVYLKKIEKLSQDDEYFDFIKLAINSLESNTELNKLELTITGMKLARKKT